MFQTVQNLDDVKSLMASIKATQFIGVGPKGSSTDSYREAWGDRANTGKYSQGDIVFVSSPKKREREMTWLPPYSLILSAMQSGATILTGKPNDRRQKENDGDRMVAAFLMANGYMETLGGKWIPSPYRKVPQKVAQTIG